MTRKRRSGISVGDEVLQTVIRVLEADDDAILGTNDTAIEPEKVFAWCRPFHKAFVDLLLHGPMACDEAVAREREETEHPTLQPDEVSILRAELLQLLRSTVRYGQSGASSSPIQAGRISFRARVAADGRTVIAATGDTRSLVILQTVLLLQEVGLANVHKCAAPDCQRLLVKVYRREFCSVQCQKRINTRKQRQTAREQKERLARRRRRRRANTSPNRT